MKNTGQTNNRKYNPMHLSIHLSYQPVLWIISSSSTFIFHCFSLSV